MIPSKIEYCQQLVFMNSSNCEEFGKNNITNFYLPEGPLWVNHIIKHKEHNKNINMKVQNIKIKILKI